MAANASTPTTKSPNDPKGKPSFADDLAKSVDEALNELEQATDEVRVKLHLANMDAKDMWETKLEPRLDEARVHAKQASAASTAAIKDIVKAFREFAQSL